MKKVTKSFKDKSIEELVKQSGELRKEISVLKLSLKVNPPKDTNMLQKKKKQLAVLQTVLEEKNVLKNIKQ